MAWRRRTVTGCTSECLWWRWAVCVVTCVAVAPEEGPAPSAPCLCLSQVLEQIHAPLDYVAVRRPHDPPLSLVVEQRGVVHAFLLHHDTHSRQPPFMDIRDRVTTSDRQGEERGLLSLALHPQFCESSHCRVFVYYITTVDGTNYAYVSEFQAYNDVVDVTSERYLMRMKQSAARGNGGQLLFGDDGFLYIFTGDGTGQDDLAGHAQDPQSLLGKALRLDVDRQSFQPGTSGGAFLYAAPADNPFVNDSAFRPELFALGFRNPWRCSQDSATRGGTGSIFCGDTGSDRYEEINLVTKGRNYGWNLMEGDYCFNSQNCSRIVTERAIYSYPYYPDTGSAVVGGYVYRGLKFPQLFGNYVYGDAISGRTFLLKPQVSSNGSVTWDSSELPVCPKHYCPCHARQSKQPLLLAFALDHQGELMLLTTTEAFSQRPLGAILRVVARAGPRGTHATCGSNDVTAAAESLAFYFLCAVVWQRALLW